MADGAARDVTLAEALRARDDAQEELRRAREAEEAEQARLLQERTGLERAIHGQRARIADLEIAVAEERAAGEARVRAAMATALPPPPAPPAKPVAFSLSRALSFASRARRALRRRIAARLAPRLTEAPQAGAVGQPSVVPPELFDAAWYTTSNPDIARAELDPWQHFLEFGLAEGPVAERLLRQRLVSRTTRMWRTRAGIRCCTICRRCGGDCATRIHGSTPAYYVDQHPEAATNPLLYHLRFGSAAAG